MQLTEFEQFKKMKLLELKTDLEYHKRMIQRLELELEVFEA